MKARGCSSRGPERKQYQAGKVPGDPGQGQGNSGASASAGMNQQKPATQLRVCLGDHPSGLRTTNKRSHMRRSIMVNDIRPNMKIVVIGGSGLIGSKVVAKLGEHGYHAVAASPASGVNTLTGEGVAEVLEGASVVVDVSNSPSFEDAAVMEFFKTSTGNLLGYEGAAGVGHHVALSVVGSDRLPDSGYLRAKIAQETLIKESLIPYSIVRATQFFEFLKSIADSATEGNT